MSDSIKAFVITHRSMPREDAFALLRADPRVEAAIARDPALEAELAEEFRRAWQAEKTAEAARASVLADSAEPDVAEWHDALVDDHYHELEDVLDPLAAPGGALVPKELVQANVLFLCPSCGERALEPRLEGVLATVRCPGCRFHTSDVTGLVHVRRAGAVEFLVGAGWRRVAIPFAYAALFVGTYVFLRWLR